MSCSKYFEILSTELLRSNSEEITQSSSQITSFTKSVIKLIEFSNLFMPEFDETGFFRGNVQLSPSILLLLWHKKHVGSGKIEQNVPLHQRISYIIKKILHGECSQASTALYLLLSEMCKGVEKNKQAMTSSFSAIARVLDTFPTFSEIEASFPGPSVRTLNELQRSVKNWQSSLQRIEEALNDILDAIPPILTNRVLENDQNYTSVLIIIRKVFEVLSGKSEEALTDVVEYAGLDHYWLMSGYAIYFGSKGSFSEVVCPNSGFILKVDLLPGICASRAESLSNFIAEHQLKQVSASQALADSLDIACLDAIAKFGISLTDKRMSKEDFTCFVLEALQSWFCNTLTRPGQTESYSHGMRSSIDERLKSNGILKGIAPFEDSQEAQVSYGILMWVCVHWANLIVDPLYPKSLSFSKVYDSMALELIRFIHSTVSTDLRQNITQYFCSYLICTPALSKSLLFEEITADMYEMFREDDDILFENASLVLRLFGAQSAVQSNVCLRYRELLGSRNSEWEDALEHGYTSLYKNVERILIMQVAKLVCLRAHTKLYSAISNYFHLLGICGRVSLESFHLILGILGALQHRSTEPGLLFQEVFCTNLRVEDTITSKNVGPSDELCRVFLCIFGKFCFDAKPVITDGFRECAFVEVCQSAFRLEKRMLEAAGLNHGNIRKIGIEMIRAETSAFEEYLVFTTKSYGKVDDQSLATCAETVLHNEHVPRSYRLSLVDRLSMTFCGKRFTSGDQYPCLAQVTSTSLKMIQTPLVG
ncbi:citrate synthase [Perkinsela sp. CCAP 1560/4]|nr:citrate synthase [Perkinsela sp. CCAP 1560/4]|eukprot:KNH07517.1 citrate synthase [Perkinsela sp. CCAP 1560/4]